MRRHSVMKSRARTLYAALVAAAIVVAALLGPGTAHASSEAIGPAADASQPPVAAAFRIVGPFPNSEMCDDYRWYVISQGFRTLACWWSGSPPRPGWYFAWDPASAPNETGR